MSVKQEYIQAAISIIVSLGLPKAQQNKRTALCLLAVLDLVPGRSWEKASAPLIGLTPIMDWSQKNYGETYAPNSRETFRRQSMHQFISAGVVFLNPDKPLRATNSPRAVYQVTSEVLDLVRTFGTEAWHDRLAAWLADRTTLVAQYARAREQHRVPVQVAEGRSITLSPGDHSELIRAIVEDFAQRFAPGSALVYVGDTGEKMGYFDAVMLADLGVEVDTHGKMPDVVLFYGERNWLLLVEAVTSHGPVDGKRHAELMHLFKGSKAGLIYVTAFPSRALMGRYLGEIAWETEVWCADSPSHLIHFDGIRFLGPYEPGD